MKKRNHLGFVSFQQPKNKPSTTVRHFFLVMYFKSRIDLNIIFRVIWMIDGIVSPTDDHNHTHTIYTTIHHDNFWYLKRNLYTIQRITTRMKEVFLYAL